MVTQLMQQSEPSKMVTLSLNLPWDIPTTRWRYFTEGWHSMLQLGRQGGEGTFDMLEVFEQE